MPQTTATQTRSAAATDEARNWNVLVRRSGEGWMSLWHTNHSEAEARAEYADRTGDAFFSRVADYRLVEGAAMHFGEVPARFPGISNRVCLVPEPVLDAEGITHAEHLR